MDAALDTHASRRAAHDAIDAQLREWTCGRDRAALVAELRALEAGGVIGARPSGL